MKTFCRKVFPGVLALLLTFTLIVPASAAEYSFSDVPIDSPWYESVAYIAERGITIGTGEGRYSPDAPITTRQWAVMLCRAYGKTDALAGDSGNFGSACLTEAYRCGWLSMEAVTNPDTQMCRGALYQSAFAAIGLPVYDYILYPDGEALTDYENCLRIGTELGLCAEGTEPMEIATRGEVAALLHAVLTQEYHVDEPPVLSEFPIQNNAGVNMNDFLLALQEVPEPVLQKFKDKGWTYTVDFDYMAALSKKLRMSCIGATSYADKTIYVSSAKATFHEFGHFIDSIVNDSTEWEKLYQAEASESILRDYAKTNSREYFADCFAYWITYSGSTKHMEFFRDTAPQTYAYMEELVVSNWGC